MYTGEGTQKRVLRFPLFVYLSNRYGVANTRLNLSFLVVERLISNAIALSMVGGRNHPVRCEGLV